MIIKQFRVGDFEVELYEHLENKNIMSRTVYTIRVDGKGTFVWDVSDEKEEAVKAYEKVIMYIVEGHFINNERNLNDIVEYLK